MEGHGEIPNHALDRYVMDFYYAAYTEYDELPFDIRGPPKHKPKSVRLGCNMIIPGLEMAIKSMKVNERAKYLINPHLAYRDHGIPPRVPKSMRNELIFSHLFDLHWNSFFIRFFFFSLADATILFIIDLVKVRVYSDEDKEDTIDDENLLFEKILNKAIRLNDEGSKIKRSGKDVNGAIKKLVTLNIRFVF